MTRVPQCARTTDRFQSLAKPPMMQTLHEPGQPTARRLGQDTHPRDVPKPSSRVEHPSVPQTRALHTYRRKVTSAGGHSAVSFFPRTYRAELRAVMMACRPAIRLSRVACRVCTVLGGE